MVSAAWNNPYPASERIGNILYASFNLRPKHLDPALSYSSNEYIHIAQIYEPPFQYHYLKRPYTLVPLTAESAPKPYYLNKSGKRLSADTNVNAIAYSVYEIRIRPDIYYQPHPCFAKDENGRYRYHNLTARDLRRIDTLADFKQSGTRELVAADYVYQIKRLAHPKVHSPIFSLMTDYIVDLRKFSKTLEEAYKKIAGDRKKGVYIDLTQYSFAGVELVDRYTYRVKIHGKYPQFRYWMAMPFFAPIPPEADQFYTQPGMEEKNLTLDWYPIGTGAYMMTVNNPNRQMVLERNPNYHDELYPDEGEPEDVARGLFADAGKRLPFIDKVVFSLEKEGIPYWNKFLQGYYDQSGVLAESFDQAIRITGSGDTELTETMQEKGISLLTSVASSTYYFGFNMVDPVVGGYSEKQRKLRQAISIAIDYEEQISIFRNGRGIAAQGPLPPGIFGYRDGQAGMNPYVYEWVDGNLQRKSIDEARRLLAEAGFPNGRDAMTGKPLLLYFDTPATGPEEKAQLDWMRKQFKKLDIELVVRATDYNRFQEKMRKGTAQLFVWGWNADYPDPENFLFLLHGPNKRIGGEGVNASNYDSPEFNRLFERMKNMENTPERAQIIDHMLDIARRDAPWAWGVHPKNFILQHNWMHNTKIHTMANNTLKYKRLDPGLRSKQREAWNRPVLWPLGVAAFVVVVGAVPAVRTYFRREKEVQR